MDNIKCDMAKPVCMERDEGVEKHLVDLRNRFKDLRKQHDAIIENSIKIIHEIGGISLKLNTEASGFEYTLDKNLKKDQPARKVLKHHLNEKRIYDSFENLNQKNILHNSIILFNRTKDSMRKLEEFLTETTKDIKCGDSKNLKIDCNTKLRYPIQKFNGLTSTRSGISIKSCFSSNVSLNGFKSIEDFGQTVNENCYATPSLYDMGYQGDLDESEHDLQTRSKLEK